MNPEARLEAMVNTLAAIDGRVDDRTRAAIAGEVARRTAEANGAGRFVAASAPPRPWRRATRWPTIGVALGAMAIAAGLAWWLGRDPAPEAGREPAVTLPDRPTPVRPTPPTLPGPQPAPAPAPVTAARRSPMELSAAQLTGDHAIWPDEATKRAIAAGGAGSLVVHVDICVGTSGAVSSVTLSRSSGFPSYDARIVDEIRTWTYRPFLDPRGIAIPVCGPMKLVYRQS